MTYWLKSDEVLNLFGQPKLLFVDAEVKKNHFETFLYEIQCFLLSIKSFRDLNRIRYVFTVFCLLFYTVENESRHWEKRVHGTVADFTEALIHPTSLLQCHTT